MSRRAKFSISRDPIELELGGEAFQAKPVIAPAALTGLIEAGEQVGAIFSDESATPTEKIAQALKAVDEVFGVVLDADSAARFHERLFSQDNPFDLTREIIPALQWLVEEYTDRPTEPSQPSSTGQSGGTSSSTSGPSAEDSTPSQPQPTAGATPSTPPSTT